MKNLKLLLIGTLSFCSLLLHAQLKFDAELRPRTEVRHGYKNLPDSGSLPAFFVSQRSRIGVNYKHEKYEMRLLIQDVRVWGDEAYYSSTGIYGDYSSLDLKEAWVKLMPTENFSLKIGRQQLKYGDQRLLAARNWNQNGMSYDAIVASYKNKFQLDAGFSYNAGTENTFETIYDTNKIKTFNYLYLNNEWFPGFKSSLIYIASGYQKSTNAGVIYLKNTLGADATYNISNTSLSVSGYSQFGKNRLGTNVNAFLLSASIKQKINPLTIGIGGDIVSGHDYSNADSDYSNTDHQFDLLYGARHSYFGYMDYFSNLPKATKGAGIIDAYFKTDYKVTEKLSAQADYHYLMLQNNVPEPNTGSNYDKGMGSEVDFTIKYNPMNEINIALGYSFFIATQTMESFQKIKASAGTEFPQWAYVMLTFKPDFYSESKEKK